MTGKKLVTLTLVMLFVMALMGGLAAAEGECPAAPDVAGQILEDNDIDFRYEAGTVEHPRHGERILYENYIAMVAQTMTNEALFPAYNWYGEWDGETYVEKCDKEAYYQAVYNYLVGLGAEIPKALTVELLEDIADGLVCHPFVTVDGNNPTVRVTDVHGNPVESLGMRVSIPREKAISDVINTDSDGKVEFDNLTFDKPGTWQANFYIADSDVRDWLAGTSRNALSNQFELVYPSVTQSGTFTSHQNYYLPGEDWNYSIAITVDCYGVFMSGTIVLEDYDGNEILADIVEVKYDYAYWSSHTPNVAVVGQATYLGETYSFMALYAQRALWMALSETHYQSKWDSGSVYSPSEREYDIHSTLTNDFPIFW